jgi:hypothetical protein
MATADLSLDLDEFLPDELRSLDDPRRDILRIAKDRKLIKLIEQAIPRIPTSHRVINRDSRDMRELEPNSVHLVVTSPPYWTLKEYRETEGQLGHVADYEQFLAELDRVWSQCFHALVPGALPARARRPARPHVLVRRGHGARPIPRHRDDDPGRGALGQAQHQLRG